MNLENLTPEEVKTLQTLLNKLGGTPVKQKLTVEDMIDEIMEEFNFAKVQDAMFHLNWKWAGTMKGIPTMDELRERAQELLESAAKSRLGDYIDEHHELGIVCQTGGFKATAWCNEAKTEVTGLKLEFIITDWESYNEE
jgi:predicted NUDIX family NTP pyrophosphohydrolase